MVQKFEDFNPYLAHYAHKTDVGVPDEASKTLNINKSAICQCAKEKNKTSNGYIWRYKKNK